MTKVGVLVCLVIVAMDAVAGILGIKAEVAKNKVIHTRQMQMKNSGCKEPSPEAFKLGLAAASLQALTHIITNLLGGCMCICCTEDLERSAANRQFWFTCLILSWIVVAVGFPMLIIGMLQNSKSKVSSNELSIGVGEDFEVNKGQRRRCASLCIRDGGWKRFKGESDVHCAMQLHIISDNGLCLEGKRCKERCIIGSNEDNGPSPEIFVVQSDVKFDSGAIPEIFVVGNVVL